MWCNVCQSKSLQKHTHVRAPEGIDGYLFQKILNELVRRGYISDAIRDLTISKSIRRGSCGESCTLSTCNKIRFDTLSEFLTAKEIAELRGAV